MLREDSSHQATSKKPHPPHNSKPPPIFLHGVIKYTEMINRLTDVADEEQFLTKTFLITSLNWHVQLQKHIEPSSSTARNKTFTITHTN